jgi:hypothetical protein
MTTPDVRDPTAYLEKLLELEWPGRPVTVTPAPLDPVEAPPHDDPRAFDVLDVLVGPRTDGAPDSRFATFRIVVADYVRRRDWIGAGCIVLEAARKSLTAAQRMRAAQHS